MSYVKHTLSSGREVEIRPMSWDEFWNFGEARTSAAKKLEGANTSEMIKVNRDLREAPLKALVKDFESIAKAVTVSEVIEIERTIDKMSSASVQEGNS